jgi:hypothetical protein
MSIHPSGSAGLPPINQALEPTWVRHGSASTKKAYDTALSFESTLVEELSRSLTASGGLDGETSQEGESGSGEGGSSASAGELSSLLPQALTGGVMRAGGLGLAAQLTRGLQGGLREPHAHATGGTAAEASAVGAASTSAASASEPAVASGTGGTDAGNTGGTAA